MTANARGFRVLVTALSILAPVACAAQTPTARWAEILRQPVAFYSSPDAARIAQIVLRYQRASGGWPKNMDMTQPPDEASKPAVDATIDNGATTTQIEFLARVLPSLTGNDREAVSAATLRGIDYLLEAQYPSGGWPQYYPLRTDYSRHITFNDNAMVNVLTLLNDAALAQPPYAFVDPERRRLAASAVERGVGMILKSQITSDGTLTAWCAQHDAVTLEPRPARAYEHASLSGSESVGIVRFLMRRPPAPEIVRAVDAAVAWLQKVRQPDGRWARFYEFGTNRPIFSGRDGVIRYRVEEIEKERQDGYAWYGTWGRTLVERDYAAWKRKQ